MKYILDFIDSATQLEIDQYLSANNIIKIRQFAKLGNVFHVDSETQPPVDSLVESIVLDEDRPIQLLDFELTLTDTTTTAEFDINDNKNWWKIASIKDVNFDVDMYQHTVRGFGGTVYLLDSGIDQTHPEFVDADIQLLHSFTNEFSDTRGHGTALASLISGKTCGLTGATIKVVKIFDTTKSTLQSDLLSSFDAVLNDYITNGRTLSVVNLSWGMAKNEYVDAKITYLRNQGLHVVAAAGNSGIPINNVTPASIPSVLTVGAYNQSLTPCDFSNYTSESIISNTNEIVNTGALDIWAPGEMIWAAGLNGTYGYIAGTSAAAAITSGAIIYNFSKSTDHTGFGSIAYNFKNILLENRYSVWDSEVYSAVDVTDLSYLSSSLKSSKRFEIDISQDSRYINSVSYAVTYNSKVLSNNSNLRQITVYAGETNYRNVFDKTTIERVTTDSLPEYWSVDTNGVFTFTYPGIEEPYIEVPAIAFEVYMRDGSVNTVILKILLVRNDLRPETVEEVLGPITDPTLRIYLLSCGVELGHCAGSCGEGQSCLATINGYTPKGQSIACSCQAII